MKWQGRQGSDNVEDRRGMGTTGKVAIGGGIGTVIIALVVLLLGGDPSGILNQGSTTTETGQYQPTAEEEQLAEFVSVVLKDTETIWGKIFQESGQTYRQPKLVLFSGQVASACGYASSSSGPFYCPGDEKVYIDLEFFANLQARLGAYGDFAIAYVVAHEIGHHVQNLLGVLNDVNSQRARLSETQSNQLLVRLELQADFLSGIYAHYLETLPDKPLEIGDIEEAMNAAASVGDDVLQKKYQGRVYPDSFTHGTAAQRKEWFRRGYQTGDFAQGDTFRANI
ncbi:MAG TPA: neutral zinc metallopeptidase [Bacteroidales bacterium]|nr:neutral zinc metallopeptidase [Bacteroidales bacterium]HOX76171.1 neutral zinc metallopeptidase [Bacteroidales bacterium]HQM70563.1 neutral zinc metallopeptidase [Bacteroidales bacterium]